MGFWIVLSVYPECACLQHPVQCRKLFAVILRVANMPPLTLSSILSIAWKQLKFQDNYHRTYHQVLKWLDHLSLSSKYKCPRPPLVLQLLREPRAVHLLQVFHQCKHKCRKIAVNFFRLIYVNKSSVRLGFF